MITINSIYSLKNKKSKVQVTGYNEIKPNDLFYKMMNRWKPERVQPLVEYVELSGKYHVCTLEDFLKNFDV